MEERTPAKPGEMTGQSGAGSLPQQAAQVKDQVQQAAVGLKDQVAEQAATRLADQKATAGEGIATVAQAIRKTGDHLRDQEQGGVAQYVDRAAEQLEQFAGYLGRRDLRELVRDAEQFARREPALFLGGAFTLGLFAARFLKSSGQASQPATNDWRGQSEWYGQPAALPSGGMRVAPAPTYPTYPGTASGMAGRGGRADADEIVGGPPIKDVIVGGPPITDAIVGSPPIDRHRE